MNTTLSPLMRGEPYHTYSSTYTVPNAKRRTIVPFRSPNNKQK